MYNNFKIEYYGIKGEEAAFRLVWPESTLSNVGLDLLCYGSTADWTLAEQLRTLLAGYQMTTRNEDNTDVSVHTYFALLLPLQLM